jgi:hypothetical protein
MASKKSSYSDRFKKEMNEIIDQLELTDLQKQFMKSRWLDQLSWLSNRAKISQKWYYRLRLMTIVGGVIIPALVSLNINDSKTREVAVWFTFGLSQVVAISAAIEEFFHYGERWHQYRQNSEKLKSEAWQFFQLGGPYQESASHQEAYVMFATRIENVIQNDVQGYVEMLQKKQQEEAEKSAAAQTVYAPASTGLNQNAGWQSSRPPATPSWQEQVSRPPISPSRYTHETDSLPESGRSRENWGTDQRRSMPPSVPPVRSRPDLEESLVSPAPESFEADLLTPSEQPAEIDELLVEDSSIPSRLTPPGRPISEGEELLAEAQAPIPGRFSPAGRSNVNGEELTRRRTR